MPPHAICESGHWQTPFAQTSPAGHALPQAPQLRASLAWSTQLPLHGLVGGAQLVTQPEGPQVCPDAHRTLQPPQFAGSLWTSTQVSPQRVNPAGQPH